MSVKLKLECSFDGTGSSWTTLTSWSGKDYLLQARGIDITRGRDDETGAPISPGTIGFVLDNADYRFSPGITSSPCYPYLEQPGSLLRLSAWVNGAWQKLFYGTAQSWTATLDGDLTGKKSICTVTATDVLAEGVSYTLRQAADEVIRGFEGLILHAPLRDTSGPAQPVEGAQVFTDNGGSGGWGLGSLLAMDEGTDKHPLFVSSSGALGKVAVSVQTETSWSCSLVLLTKPTASGTIMQLATAGYGGNPAGLTVGWSSVDGFTNPASATPTGLPAAFPVILHVYSDAYGSYVAAFSADGSNVVSGGWPLGALSKVTLNPTLSGGSQWCAGHLAVTSGVTYASFTTAAAILSEAALRLLGPRTLWSPSATEHPAKWVARRAGIDLVMPSLNDGSIILPPCEGLDASEVLSSIVTGCGARIVDDLNGSVNWLDFGPSTTPVAIPKTTADLAWGTSSTGWMSDQTVTFPDGSTYTATRSDGARKTGPGQVAVHSDSGKDRSMADWNVHSGTLGGRCSQVPVDMMGLTEAQRASLAAIAPGSRITPPSYAYMPAGLILIVEGVEHHINAETWTATFKTSPDIYSRLFILDDPVQGVLDAGYLLAP